MPKGSCKSGQLKIDGKCKDKEDITVQELAGEFSKYFKKQKQNNGQEIIILEDGRPEELYETVQEAHGDMFPDDFKYEFIKDAINDIASSEDPEEEAGELIDSDVDVYTHDLTKWLGSRNDRFGYVDEAVKEMGHSEDGIMKEIMMGQYKEREEVYYAVLNRLKKILED